MTASFGAYAVEIARRVTTNELLYHDLPTKLRAAGTA